MFNNNLKYRILNLSFKMRYFYAPLSIRDYEEKSVNMIFYDKNGR